MIENGTLALARAKIPEIPDLSSKGLFAKFYFSNPTNFSNKKLAPLATI